MRAARARAALVLPIPGDPKSATEGGRSPRERAEAQASNRHETTASKVMEGSSGVQGKSCVTHLETAETARPGGCPEKNLKE